jgi:signal transduction histidine kinase
MSPSRARALAWPFAGVALAMIGVALVVGATTGTLATSAGTDGGILAFAILVTVAISTFAVMGSLIARRQPSNPIGWLFITIGLTFGFTLAGGIYGEVGSSSARAWANWLTNWSGGAVMPLIVLVLLLFPDGRLLSRRWRLVLWADIAGTVFLVVGIALTPGTLGGEGPANPVGIPGIEGSVLDEGGLGWILVPLAMLAAGVSLILRYRRASGIEREQLRWLAFSAALVIAGLVLNEATYQTRFEDIGILAIQLAIVTFPLAVGAAILRYHLYDIDVVINRTVVYATLAAFITGVYVAIVVGIGAFVGGSGDAPNAALSIAATAVVAIAFQPVRELVQRLANRLVYGKRATPYEVMADFGSRMAGTLELGHALPELAEAAAMGVRAAAARVRLALPGGGERAATWPEGAEPTSWERTVDVVHEGEPIGEISVAKDPGDPLLPAERALLDDLAHQAGLALHNVRLTDELQARADELERQAEQLEVSRRRLVTARDAQRRGLERDIREGPRRELEQIGQTLERASELAPTAPAEAVATLDEVTERANAILEGLRDMARGIFPPLLADQGIVLALEAHIRKVDANATLDVASAVRGARFDADVEACAYFVCLQAIQNVLRHAGNAPTIVRLWLEGGDLVFEVADRGPGFDVPTTGGGMGLQIMRDRIDALDGSLELDSARGRGTTVTGRVPARALSGVGT